MSTSKPETRDLPEHEETTSREEPIQLFNPWDDKFSGDFKINEREFDF